MITKHTIPMLRSSRNPLITPQDVKPSIPNWEVIGAFNAGVAQHGDEIILLLRVAERPVQSDPDHVIVPVLDVSEEVDLSADEQNVLDARDVSVNLVSQQMLVGREKLPVMTTVKLNRHDPELDFQDPRVIRDHSGKTLYLTSISHLRIARSRDGETFTIDESPSIMPTGRLESWGIEDPRITKLDDQYYITYSAISDKGVSVGLLSTRDFAKYDRIGLILAPTNKDVVIFPERIDGRYYMLHRPVPDSIGNPEMWLAESTDMTTWGNHRYVMGLRDGMWDNARIGAGCVPIRTDDGWLILYHGADREHRYCMGAALLDLQDPGRVIARMEEPFLIPEAAYETNGFFPGVVFACGALVRDGTVMMYYGVSDDSMALVSFELSELMKVLRSCKN